jgi:hypothetical protein
MGKKSLIKSTTKKKTSTPKSKAKEVKPPPEEVVKPEQSATPQETAPLQVPEELETASATSPETTAEPDAETANTEAEPEDSPKSVSFEPEEKAPDAPPAEAVVEPVASLESAESTNVQPEADVKVTYGQGPPPQRKDPMDNFAKIFLGALALLIVLVVGASIANSGRYYLKKAPAGFDVWKGKFAPLGKEHLIRVVGVEPPQSIKAIYSRNEVAPVIFKYYLNQADALLLAGGTPDFDTMKVLLNDAQKYAITNELSQQADRRLVTIDFNNLLYKADVAASYGDKDNLKASLEFLHQAGRLRLDDLQKTLLNKKLETVKTKMDGIEGGKAAAKPAAKPKAAAKPQPKPTATPETAKSDH